MLAEDPLSTLDCYEPSPRHRIAPRLGAVSVAAALLALGLLPTAWLRQTSLLWDAWLIATLTDGALAAWLLVGAGRPGHRAAADVTAGVLA